MPDHRSPIRILPNRTIRANAAACWLGVFGVMGIGFPDGSGLIHGVSTASAATLDDGSALHEAPAGDDWSRSAFVQGARALEPGFPEEARRAAARWLADRLALPALADDPDAAWEAWGAWVLLPDASFYRRLAENYAARSDAAAREREQLLRRLADRREALVGVYRRLYARLPAEERSGLLVEMLGSEVVAVQTAACQLAMRTLQNAGELDPAVTQATVEALDSRDAGLRVVAVQLIEQLDPAMLASLARTRLQSEPDPAAAAAMLRAIATRATEAHPAEGESSAEEARQLAAAAVRWLELVPMVSAEASTGDASQSTPAISEARVAAFDAAVAVLRRKVRVRAGGQAGETGMIPPRDPVMVRAADHVAAALPVRVTPESVALLASLQRFETVVQLLQSESGAVARAAADGLAGQARFVDPIVRAAMTRPELFDAALDALAAHRPTADAFVLAQSIATTDASNRRARLVAMASRLPGEQLLLAMRKASEEELVEACLMPLLLVRQSNNGEAGANGRVDGRVEPLPRDSWTPELELALAARLAWARLSLDELLGTLDVLALMRERHAAAFTPAGEGTSDGVAMTIDRLVTACIEAGVRLNRLDYAAELLIEHPTLVGAWVAAIERIEADEPGKAAAERLLTLEREHEHITLTDVLREQVVGRRDAGDPPQPPAEPVPSDSGP